MTTAGKAHNLDELIAPSRAIWTKYEDASFYLEGGAFSFRKKFSDTLDRYFLHTIEETVEVKMAVTMQEKLEERVDVALYLMTLADIVSAALKGLGEGYSYGYSIWDVYRGTDEVTDYLMRARMLYPERKWHKPAPEMTKHEVVLRTIGTADLIKGALRRAIWEAEMEHGQQAFLDQINKKRGFVIDLAPVGGTVL
jgi:hypothetical protein